MLYILAQAQGFDSNESNFYAMKKVDQICTWILKDHKILAGGGACKLGQMVVDNVWIFFYRVWPCVPVREEHRFLMKKSVFYWRAVMVWVYQIGANGFASQPLLRPCLRVATTWDEPDPFALTRWNRFHSRWNHVWFEHSLLIPSLGNN
jgi:hypothetical protein